MDFECDEVCGDGVGKELAILDHCSLYAEHSTCADDEVWIVTIADGYGRLPSGLRY